MFCGERYLTTFGLVAEYKTQKNTIGLLSGDFNGDGYNDLAAVSELEIRLFLQNPDSLSFQTSTIILKRPIIAAAPARLNNDKSTDLVLVTDNPISIQSYVGKSNGQFYRAWEKTIPIQFENILVADINGDNKSDIIFYGKKELGLTVYLGNGNGSFRSGFILFPEYSVSALSVAKLHDIGDNDIIATNWISNELLIYSNYGKMKFSDPTVLQFGSEPSMVKCDYFDSDINMDLVVGLPDEHKIQLYSGDGFGNFELHQTILREYVPTAIGSADVNGDGAEDLGVLSIENNSLDILLNKNKGMFEEDVPLFAGNAAVDFTFFRNGKSKNVNAAVLDTSRNCVKILYNAKCKRPPFTPQIYAAGIKPGNVCITDLNKDRRKDIFVANQLSKNYSLFLNEHGEISGQIPFSVSSSPAALTYYKQDDSSAILVSTNSEGNRISVSDLNPYSLAQRQYALPTPNGTTLLAVSSNSDGKHLRLFAFEHDERSGQGVIVKFDQIYGDRFVERYYSLNQFFPVLAASMGNYDGTKTPQFTFAAYDPKQKKEFIYQTNMQSNDEFSTAKTIFSLDLPEAINPIMKTVDLNKDRYDDLIVNLGEPENKLYIFLGRKDTTLLLKKKDTEDNILISSIDKIKFYDMNADGIPDMIYENEKYGLLRLRRGSGDGTLSRSETVARIGNIGGFDIADINNDSIPELLLTDYLNGILKIIPLSQ